MLNHLIAWHQALQEVTSQPEMMSSNLVIFPALDQVVKYEVAICSLSDMYFCRLFVHQE